MDQKLESLTLSVDTWQIVVDYLRTQEHTLEKELDDSSRAGTRVFSEIILNDINVLRNLIQTIEWKVLPVNDL